MINPETVAREKILFAYSLALEQGDFARLEKILEQAGADPILERQIFEMHAALSQPSAEAVMPVSKQNAPDNLFRWLKTSLSALFSNLLWIRPTLRVGGTILAVLVILLVVGSALLGPAVGNIFSNVVSYAPHDRSMPQSQRVESTVQVAYSTQTAFLPMGTPTPYANQQSNAYNAYPAPGGSQPQPAERMIVRNGSLNLVVKDTRQARQAVMTMVSEYAAEGAFIVSANETYPYNNQMPVISMSLRIPVKHYDETMARLAGLSIQVLGRQETAQDVTQSFVDVSARVEALQVSRERLLQIVKEAKNSDDLLRAEQELSQREAELNATKATQKYLEQTAALSSITLDLQPPEISQPVTDNTWNPAVTLRNAFRVLLANLRGFADGLIYFVIVTLPWLVVLGLLIFGAVRLFRKR